MDTRLMINGSSDLFHPFVDCVDSMSNACTILLSKYKDLSFLLPCLKIYYVFLMMMMDMENFRPTFKGRVRQFISSLSSFLGIGGGQFNNINSRLSSE